MRVTGSGFRQIPAERLRPFLERALEEHGSIDAFCSWAGEGVYPRLVWRTLNEVEHVTFDVADALVVAIDPMLWHRQLADLLPALPRHGTGKTMTRRRLDDDAVRQIHAYLAAFDVRVSHVTEMNWGRWGYGSERSCHASLCAHMQRLGLRAPPEGRPRVQPKRRGNARVDAQRASAKMNERQVRAAHALYLSGRSLDELGSMLWERFEYASSTTCADCLRLQFVSFGLPVRRRGGVRKTSEEQLDMAVRLYESGRSTRDIADRYWREFGYRSQASAWSALKVALRSRGVMRSRSEAGRLRYASRLAEAA